MEAERKRIGVSGWLIVLPLLSAALALLCFAAIMARREPPSVRFPSAVFAEEPSASERPRLIVHPRPTAADGTEPTPVTEPGSGEGSARSNRYRDASGIHLFPPPGTRPPHSGIIVPEDFDLPAGYLRHHQTTDDGRALPPILMFHPDYEIVDEEGHPIEIPQSRVVPPRMAPPGMPIEILEIPPVEYPTPPPHWKKLRKLWEGER